MTSSIKTAVIFLGICFCTSAHSDQPLKAITQSAYSPSIVKLYTKGSVVTDNIRCDSEGTGFFIAPEYILTADHVTFLPEGCGTVTIKAVSHVVDWEGIVSKISSREDIAILKVNTPLHSELCSGVVNTTLPLTLGYRFSIAGANMFPTLIDSNIYMDRNEFSPDFKIQSAEIYDGDSGSPVFSSERFKIIGLLVRKDKLHPIFGKIKRADAILGLLKENNITMVHTCKNWTVATKDFEYGKQPLEIKIITYGKDSNIVAEQLTKAALSASAKSWPDFTPLQFVSNHPSKTTISLKFPQETQSRYPATIDNTMPCSLIINKKCISITPNMSPTVEDDRKLRDQFDANNVIKFSNEMKWLVD